MEQIRVGVVGCGGIANSKHLPAHRREPRSRLVAFCDVVEERAVRASKEYGAEGCRVYTDYRELLKDKSIDVVLVLTPNNSHCEIVCAALDAGKHVLCEKPMAIGYAEAKKMLAARDRSNKVLTIGYQNRYRGDSLYLKRLADEDAFGEIYYAEALAVRGAQTNHLLVADASDSVERDERAADLVKAQIFHCHCAHSFWDGDVPDRLFGLRVQHSQEICP